jgi:DMSO/TMAO reductase YedYZ molybdopterin-dependent catalytic subunit
MRARPSLAARFDALEPKLRVGPLKHGAFRSRLHTERLAAILGLALGVSFGMCFLTGLLSHLIQHPPSWFLWPSRPAGLYRVTQGIHVTTGVATIPLLFAKLWTVYPKLWRWPPLEDATHAVERFSLLPLVGGATFMLFTGLGNIAYWRPWGFFFPPGHFWGAWITIGALIVHIGAKATRTRVALSRRSPDLPEPAGEGLSRRGFFGVVASAVGILAATTIGQTVRPLRRLAFFAPRRPDVGPQGFPINKTARQARVLASARDPAWRLRIEGDIAEAMELSLDELRAMPQHEASLPISCVEGWSANVRWRGVRMRDLLDAAGAPRRAEVVVESLQRSGQYRASTLNRWHARDPDTLLALEANGGTLDIEHGYPARLIGPNRPGVMQTKWVSRLMVRRP